MKQMTYGFYKREKKLYSALQSKATPATVEMIDRIPVIYRKTSRFDFEIFGGYHRRPFVVIAWALGGDGFPQQIESVHEIQSEDIPAAAEEIDRIIAKYEEAPHEL